LYRLSSQGEGFTARFLRQKWLSKKTFIKTID